MSLEMRMDKAKFMSWCKGMSNLRRVLEGKGLMNQGAMIINRS